MIKLFHQLAFTSLFYLNLLNVIISLGIISWNISLYILDFWFYYNKLLSKQTIYIKYVDYWYGFDHQSEYFWILLSNEFNLVYSDNPDFIIYSNYGLEHLQYNCIWIFISYENERPNFNVCDFAMTPDYCNSRYHYQMPVFATVIDKKRLIQTNKDELFFDWKNRDQFCSFVVSN